MANNFNEELKKMEAEQRLHDGQGGQADEPIHLDDTQRVKVLSPGRLVFKRFIRNKLAIVGSAILLFMFLFCFAGPLFYPYGQTEKFYKTDILENSDFAAAKERTEYSSYKVDMETEVHYSVVNMINFSIRSMEQGGKKLEIVSDADGKKYCLLYEAQNVYTLNSCELTRIGTKASAISVGVYDMFNNGYTPAEGTVAEAGFAAAVTEAVTSGGSEFTFNGSRYIVENAGKKRYDIKLDTGDKMNYVAAAPGEGFETAMNAALGNSSFECGGDTYLITKPAEGVYEIDRFAVGGLLYVCSPYAVNLTDGVSMASNDFVREALISFCTDGTFSDGGKNYTVREGNGELEIMLDGSDEVYGLFTTFSVSRANGSGALPLEFKNDVKAKIEEMIRTNTAKSTLVTKVEKQAQDGSVATDESGNVIYADTEIIITRKGEDYAITCDRLKYLIDIYAAPFSETSDQLHLIGTDGDGYDILARMMYGGRVSLIVGFVVVIIETLLGIVMGGLSGYFGGWVDTLIMRIVDVFYCIPSMPILIILGAFFDAEQMNAYVRLMWLMAVLGFLGWAGVARLVRGQILSLREQEFMLATEVSGLKVSRRIFRHLIPNVMPQLIVTATAGLGSVILTESTLSFLGLGVKHPLATWGTMINSVSDYSSMVNYTYIWIPVGMLICLTVIAFNFVGDGLRDAFDPKMKR